MRIEAYNQIQQVYNSKGVSKAQNTTKVSFSDQLQISSAGKDFQVAKTAVKASPDVREDLVATIKASMEAGTYRVSNEDLADKLIDNYFEMR